MEHEPTINLTQLFDQKLLNDLIRDLNLSKNEAEILGSTQEKRNDWLKFLCIAYLKLYD